MGLYVITHKSFNSRYDLRDRKTLLVGAANGNGLGKSFNFYDNSGENISNKNKNFCELTGIYWLWKNSNDDYIGIEHYRRFFCHDLFGKKLMSNDEVKKLLRKYDIILPFKKKFNESVKEDYINNSGYKKDLDNLRLIIQKDYPEYLKSYDDVFSGDTLYLYNMMILDKRLFDEYCKWLFDILFSLEKVTSLDGYTDYEKRIYGFVSERLLNVWIKKNGLNTFSVGVINTEQKTNLIFRFLAGWKRYLFFKSQIF